MSALDANRIITSATLLETRVNVAGSALLIFDYLLTLNREIELVWKRPWSTISILFLITRYTPFADTVSTLITYFPVQNPSMCRSSFQVQSIFSVIGICASEAILVTRTAAVWGNSKRIFWGLIALMTLIAVTSAVLVEKYVTSGSPGLISAVLNGTVVHYCPSIKGDSSMDLAVPWILVLIFETILVCLMLPKAISQKIFGTTSIYDAVYVDGVRFYLCTSAISLINIIVLLYPFPESALQLDIMQFDRILHAILAERLILSIRSAAAGTAIIGTATFSEVEFYIPSSRN